MEILNQREDWFPVDEEFLNFSVVSGGFCASLSPLKPTKTTSSSCGSRNISVHEPEEDLEWISNKNAFPAIETCFGILAENPELVFKSKLKSDHHSPVSVLENSGICSNSSNPSSNGGTSAISCCDSLKIPKYPVRPRTKSRKPRTNFRFLWLSILETVKNNQELSFSSPPIEKKITDGGGMGRRCLHCQVDKTPQWRTGPMGPKTLCNACGVRYKSGRLVQEYRPANSPTFSSALHSNSHRKVVEMRKRKQLETGGVGAVVNEAFGYRVRE